MNANELLFQEFEKLKLKFTLAIDSFFDEKCQEYLLNKIHNKFCLFSLLLQFLK